MSTPALSQDELKTLVGQAALQYVVPGEVVGVGTGSTVNKFIDALASMKDQIKGAVSSSKPRPNASRLWALRCCRPMRCLSCRSTSMVQTKLIITATWSKAVARP
ncbi:MAG: hypothetical protein RLY90_952 [Pseudomonadota bacterium]